MNGTQEILNIFSQISSIPRASFHEQQISAWLQGWAAQHHLEVKTDEAGNLVICVPASSGFENAPAVILQGHMDMVCEKTPDVAHDFSKDPIRCIVDGDWLHADRTTLGADNGIALAIALTLVEDPEVQHPPLELLFTVEEETGIGGASKLQKGFLHGKTLINLDSETEGVFIIGCAGGKNTHIRLPVAIQPIGYEEGYELSISGLKGGHSGVDVHKNRANAIHLLARALDGLTGEVALTLGDIKGGTAHNAIPRDATAWIAMKQNEYGSALKFVEEFQIMIADEYMASEGTIAIDIAAGRLSNAMTYTDTMRSIDLLLALPTGVSRMSPTIPGFVSTSNNLAKVEMVDDNLQILSSQRSVATSELIEITSQIEAVGHLAGAQVWTDDGYPAWQPDKNSKLLSRSKELYEQIFGIQPKVELIHAGLECGVIGDIFGEMDMISLGATILDPHSPNERLYIPSVSKVYRFLTALLATLSA
jgi:dipeptidase D